METTIQYIGDPCPANHQQGFQATARRPPLLPCHEVGDVKITGVCLESLLKRLQKKRPSVLQSQVLDKECATRLAARWQTTDGAEALWKFALELGSSADPGVWLGGAALVLAAVHGKVVVDLPALPDSLLASAVSLLKTPLDAAALALEVFKCDFGLAFDTQTCSCSLASLLWEQARRCESDPSAQEPLLIEAFMADEENSDVRGALLKLLLQHLEGGTLDKEDVLLKLLFFEHNQVPKKLLSKLSLAAEHVRVLEPASCVTLANQLQEEGRPEDGAKVAVIAAEAFDACGSKEEAQSSYILAYNMDRRNPDAAHGVVESCAYASRTCEELREQLAGQQEMMEQLEGQQETIEEQNERINSLDKEISDLKIEAASMKKELENSKVLTAVRGFTWDLSSEDFSAFQRGQVKNSPKVYLPGLGIKIWLQYYPQGASDSPVGRAALYLARSAKARVCATISVDSVDRDITIPIDLYQHQGFGNPSFIRVGQHEKISVIIKSVQLEGSKIEYLF